MKSSSSLKKEIKGSRAAVQGSRESYDSGYENHRKMLDKIANRNLSDLKMRTNVKQRIVRQYVPYRRPIIYSTSMKESGIFPPTGAEQDQIDEKSKNDNFVNAKVTDSINSTNTGKRRFQSSVYDDNEEEDFVSVA